MKNFALVLFFIFTQQLNAETFIGFSDEGTALQKQIESDYDKNINAVEMDEWMRYLSKEPHHVGSEAGKKNAEYIAGLFKSWGFEVEIEEYHVLIPTPLVRELSLISPSTYKATLTEESLIEDPSTFVRENLLPPYNAFSIDGEVEGECVDAPLQVHHLGATGAPGGNEGEEQAPGRGAQRHFYQGQQAQHV